MTANNPIPDGPQGSEPYELTAPAPVPRPVPPEVKYPDAVELPPSPQRARAIARAGRNGSRPPTTESPPAGDDLEIAKRLQSSKAGRGSSPSQAAWKNWRLQGSGFQPFAVYGSLAILFGGWLAGACILFAFGPWATLVLLAGLFGIVWRITSNERLREQREWAGACPQCGYDLRATPIVCPECGTPVPEVILRRRRTEERIRQARLGAPPQP